MTLKRFFKQNTHSLLFKALAGFGRSMNRFYENRNHDALSNGEYRVLSRISRLNPKIILDVGANVGNYAELIVQTNPTAMVYCFEPVKDTFLKLNEKFKSLAHKNIKLFQQGLFNENKTQEINLYPGDEHASLFDIKGIDYKIVKKEMIELVSFDSFMAKEKIAFVDFIKLDLEGAEMDAMHGMQEALMSKKIRAIQFEYGYINITTKHLLADYYEFFQRHGYILGKIYPKTVEFRDYQFKHEDFIGPNFIAVHSSDSELIGLLQD